MKNSLIQNIPKAELHLHIEGSLEPALMMQLAKKHNVPLPYNSIEQIQAAYNFDNLQSFLDLYYLGAAVLQDEDDFYQLMIAYFKKCQEDNIKHCEIMFDPQTHTHRNIPFKVFMNGFKKAMNEAQETMGISSQLIMCFLRHLDEDDAIKTLEQAKPFLNMISTVGLDSSEAGNPPEKFQTVFKQAKTLGLNCVAHAGEEGPAEYIWSALNDLNVQRIDHGVRCVEDEILVEHLINTQMPLTVCPLSNIKLCVFDNMQQHNIISLLNKGMCVTVNADDPSYFGGYLNDNFYALDEALCLSDEQIKQLAINSFNASFLSDADKSKWIRKIQQF
ncbi:adenosine deaminase [Marinicellulosiphila megalodicopiae]|uniref:adenosine deaminase n=1 Tax=Marinicellulosiphila megalodicopiae TaxID=2724896 RepID=UPI003BAFE4BA